MKKTDSSRWGRRLACTAVALCMASPAQAAPIETIAPGIAVPLPSKTGLARRDDLVVATVAGGLFGGDSTGGEVFGELRLGEVFGIGGGVKLGSSTTPFIRMTPIGLAIRHWTWLAYADYDQNGWSFGGAMIVPVRKNNYLRFFVGGGDGRSMAGVGLEHDVW